MIWRAVFFIAAVALFAPHQPGFGSLGALASACSGGTCTLDSAMMDGMKDRVLLSLARVKADIAEARRQRAAGG
jgi:hypothetical protein